ncbi:MAG TPA: ferrous iron transport protein B [Actinomycetota bacterium]
MNSCHAVRPEASPENGAILLVGNPNVGKSALFAALTGRYVAVSNYPGTTVEIARGAAGLNGAARAVVDTPGIRGTVPISDDERVARDLLMDEERPTIVQVADAKNLRRSLLLTLELAETGLPMVLAVNMTDEAEARGITVDLDHLSALLGVPVVGTVATRRSGVDALEAGLPQARPAEPSTSVGAAAGEVVARVAALVPPAPFPPRGVARMLLSGDDELADRLDLSHRARDEVARGRQDLERLLGVPAAVAFNRSRLAAADRIVEAVVTRHRVRRSVGEAAGRVAAHPLLGWPILAVVLVLVYLLVGRLGAGTLVDLLEDRLFGEVVNPWARDAASRLIPVGVVERFLVGPYGLVTMALTYGLAIILPVVATFFFAFGALEDSGYLPRLALLLDRSFRRMGLNGKAVLPMVLGLGCVTLATMTTRVLETRKERLQVTLLLALSVPCSAQLGVILGMIAATGAVGTAVWSGVVVASLLAVGFLSAKVIPGPVSDFVLELPPLRVPSVRNLALKTGARMEWYLKEVIPVFVLGTAILFALDETGLLGVLERGLSPVVQGWLGLPAAATGVLLIGFLRRDYGAAGLFALALQGALSPAQVLVALVVITLFVPCIASVLVIVREFGARVAAAMLAFVFGFALGVGGLLNLALEVFDVRIG